MKKINLIFGFFLLVIVAVQLGVNVQPAARELAQMRANIGKGGLWRSANFHHSLRFANFIEFLLEKIPVEARVVLLPTEKAGSPLDSTPVMQFFLAPRQVFNCTEADCLRNISPTDTVVVINDAQQRQEMPDGARVLDFDPSWGLAFLDGGMSMAGAPLAGFSSLLAFLWALILPAAWLGAATICGAAILRDPLHHLPVSLRLALGAGFSLSLLSLGLAAGWLAGLRLTAALVTGVSAGLVLWAVFSLARNRSRPPAGSLMPRLRIDPWLAGILFIGAIAAVLSVGRGLAATDEVLLWGAKGRGLAASGDLSQVTQWGTNTVPYPLHIPLLIAACELLFAEGLAAFKLVPALYGTSLAVLVYGYLNRWGVKGWLAGLSSLAAITAPLWFRHTTLAYANLPLVYALTAGCLLLVDELAAPAKPGWRMRSLLSGAYIAFAAWTRPEGWVFGLGAAAAIWAAAAWGWRKHAAAHPAWNRLGWMAAPLLLYGAFWFLLHSRVYAGFASKSDLIPAAAAAVLSGNLHIEAVGYILGALLTRLFSPDAWGLWIAGLGLSLMIGAARRAWRFPSAALALAGALGVTLALGMYYVTSYDTVKDLSWWISTGMDRMLMPGLLLLWLAGMATFAERNEIT